MAVIFDGKEFAEEEIKRLSDEVIKLEKKRGRKLKLATIYNPEHKPSRVYTNIKAKCAEDLGIEFEKFSIFNYQFSINDLIIKLNNDKKVDGVMIQMPLTGDREQDAENSKLIAVNKDVDGLNPDSGVMPATVRAVIAILRESLKLPITNYQFSINDLNSKLSKMRILVVGNKGLVGSRLQEQLGCEGMDEENFDPSTLLRADVVISCTGQTGLIKPEMVKPGVTAIDVGYPGGDFDPGVAKKASFFTPVPGGVGPVTVVKLFANLVDLVRKSALA